MITRRTRRTMKFGGIWLVLLAALCSLLALKSLAAQSTKKQNDSIPVKFTDIRKQSGITFLQDSTQTEEKLYLETMGTGVAWLDYDQDGLMDLYFVQSGPTDLYKPDHPMRSALYHNNGDGTFTDVTEKAGVAAENHYGQGVAVGDYDNDSYPDIYVTGYGSAILYHNNGDGTFTDVAKKAGVGDEGNWSTSAAWIDYDKDGYLDLVVTNYIEWSPKNNSRWYFQRCQRFLRRWQARGKRNGRRRRGLQQRWLAGYRHRQRLLAKFSLHQQTRRHASRCFLHFRPRRQ